jgi:hypothetical protein
MSTLGYPLLVEMHNKITTKGAILSMSSTLIPETATMSLQIAKLKLILFIN